MRSAPLNYLITFVLAGLLWVLTALILGGYLGNTVALTVAYVEDFVQTYRILVSVAAVLGLLLAFWWYYYGSRPTTVGELDRAGRFWTTLFIVGLALAVGVLVALLILFREESFTVGQYALFFGVFSLHTWLFFWISTLLMSPRTVQTIPWGR
ncbi:MAG: hypothetical protein HKN04_03085 [Rhodothermaceae bacterium]|nr:hypothetical protein [Rhodothermaceae bacterium]